MEKTMKKQIYLHIGTFKTGTSSIQRYLYEKKEELEEKDFFFPIYKFEGGGGGQFLLPLSLIKEYSDFRAGWPEFEARADDVWNNIFGQIQKANSNKIIISAESFCDFVHPAANEGIEKYKEYLKKYFKDYDVKVICYLRSLDKYISSLYGEVIKVSDVDFSVDEFIRNELERDGFHLNPVKFLDFFTSIFGRENLILRNYDRNELKNGDVVDDFLSILKLDKVGFSADHNRSIPFEYLALKRAINKNKIKGHDINQQISRLLISAIDESEAQDLNDREELLKKINENIDNLNKRYSTGYHSISDFSLKEKKYSEETIFLIELMGHVIKQNRNQSQRLTNLENMIRGQNSKLETLMQRHSFF
jgi:hypothetical protein